MENKLFKPEKEFIEHKHNSYKDKLKRVESDFEYQRELGKFLVNALEESNLEISDQTKAILNPTSEDSLGAMYIEASKDLRNMFNGRVLSQPFANKRVDIDEDIKNIIQQYEKKRDSFSGSIENKNDSVNDLVTREFRKKIDFNKLLKYLDDPDLDQSRKNLLILFLQIMDPDCIPKRDEKFYLTEDKANRILIGSCSMAERYMLGYISGALTKSEISGGYVNLIVDENNSPIMVEKIFLGESNSSITLQPVRLGSKYIPAGTILETVPRKKELTRRIINLFTNKKKEEGALNYVTKLSEYKGFKFLRFSILSVSPELRQKSCGYYFNTHHNKSINSEKYINYDWITTEIIAEYARERLKLDA